MVEGEPKQTGEQPATEIVMESVRDHIYRELTELNPLEEPEKYLELLDHYEEILLHEKQEKRRARMMERLIGHRL